MQAIRFHEVTKRYGSVLALDNLSFDMPAGCVVGFLGPNGAGKTTSFRALLGITRADSGEIQALDLAVGPDTPAIVKRVGALVEDPGHHPALTARANLEVAAATLGRGDDQIGRLLHHVGLEEDADRKVAGFSKGMRQRLGMAAALLGDPEMLVVDEPLDGLDPAGQVAFKDELRKLAVEDGKTIVMSSHDLGDVEELADYVVVIDRGALVVQGPTDELLAADPHVRLQIDDVEGARSTLAAADLAARIDEGDLLVSTDDGALVAEVLARDDRYPRSLIPESASLEQMFLKLTGSEAR